MPISSSSKVPRKCQTQTSVYDSNQKKEKQPARKPAKFIRTNDPYNIPPEKWIEIGEAFVQSASTCPSQFGDPLRNFKSHCHELKAAEWATVAKVAAPIFLKGLLPQQDYEGLTTLIDAIILLEQYTFTSNQAATIQSKLEKFSKYYENRFYRMEWNKLQVYLPSLHQVMHIQDSLKAIGPMYVYWQWPMER